MRMDWQELNPADPQQAARASGWAWTDLPMARASRADVLRQCCAEFGISYPPKKEAIQAAYRGLVLQYHPDKADAASREQAEERMKHINVAHRELLQFCNDALSQTVSA